MPIDSDIALALEDSGPSSFASAMEVVRPRLVSYSPDVPPVRVVRTPPPRRRLAPFLAGAMGIVGVAMCVAGGAGVVAVAVAALVLA